MAKRGSLTFDAVKASKAAPPAGEPAPPPAPAAEPSPKATRRGRGRPAKREEGVKLYGMTLRIPSAYRNALRRAAEQETDRQGRVVSVHDVILEAVEKHLRRKGIAMGGQAGSAEDDGED